MSLTRSDPQLATVLRHGRLVRVVLLALGAHLSAPTTFAEGIDFNRDIRPILSENCFFCHGPAEDSREADLRLDIRDDAIDYGAIVPGDPLGSYLVERIDSDDADLMMPPPESNKSLEAEEKELLQRWVASGAHYDEHWSFEPLPASIEPPAYAPDSRLVSAIDRFVNARLRQEGLEPNLPVDRSGWLRRVTFDLTGLPPSREEIDAFVGDRGARAFERVVDRLLASDAHAERMASEWLDVARYSDSYGYQRDDERFVWPYRDWVIDAFRRNQPYDEFVTWQLAGDLLPHATREQRLATTFCRLHSHKKEGGVAVEEFRVENVADRTHTFASAFLGLTMECARCHDHKYDPITAKEYYELSSFFANVDERGLISYFTDATPTPAMPLPSAEQEADLAAAEEGVRRAEAALASEIDSARSRFHAWTTKLADRPIPRATPVASIDFDHQVASPPEELLWEEDTGFVEAKKKPLDPGDVLAFENNANAARPAITVNANLVVPGREGRGVRLTGDDAIVIPGAGRIERSQSISVAIWIKPAALDERAVVFRRSGGWDDAGSMGYALIQRGPRLRATVAHFWPGNALCVETDEVLQPDRWRHVVVTYDGSSRAEGLKVYVDGRCADAHVVADNLTRTISDWRGGYLDFAIGSRYRDRGFAGGVVDDLRIFDRALTAIEAEREFGESHSEDDPAMRFAYFVAVVDKENSAARCRLQEARRRRDAVRDSIPAITVMREQHTPRPAFLLERGAYDARGEEVFADTPAVLPDYPADQPRNRLGLARWLFQPDHPLTARVAVNRYWQMLFGEGLVRSPEDFGSQGDVPSHPELLDWLARDFVDGGWDVRRLLRTVVLSETYKQSSVVSRSVRERDPENRLLSRGPAKRLTAEMTRDSALAVSGLLDPSVGGPPVKPYDLALAYTPLDSGGGSELYRRSLYTFWKRTSPSPVMMTMNANRREVCVLRREAVSSPLQALVLLNGTQFIEASRTYAERLLKSHGRVSEALIDEAFVSLTGRAPEERERAILLSSYDEQLASYESDPPAARGLTSVGDSDRGEGASLAELAATTVLINVIMNTDEATRCR